MDCRLRDAAEAALYEYADAADARDSAAVARVLGDAIVHFGDESAEDRESVQDLFARKFSDAPPARHLVANLQITGEAVPDRVAVRATYLRVLAGSPPESLSIGRYHATVEVRDGIARFVPFDVLPEGLRHLERTP